MIGLSTNYLGMHLKNPLVCSSSPLCQDLGALRRMEDCGAAAVVLQSLFEEQIDVESQDLDRFLEHGTDSYAESLNFFPNMTHYNTGPDGYLEHVRRAKEALSIPVIASLNGTTPGGWVRYAKMIEQAGADALELNVYYIPTDPRLTGGDVEQRYLDVVRAVRTNLKIPIAVKLGPFFTSLAEFSRELEAAGAAGLVLFNRFYQPDFNLETLEVEPRLHLSTPDELLLRLHWVAILFDHLQADLAVTGGVHSAQDVLKSMMAGARVAMMTSALLKHGISHGISHVGTVLSEMIGWMREHEYHSVRQMQGSMSLWSATDPAAFQRANYMKVLRSYALRTTT
jgi:dihydroorotate dehydrogenase (fumarate)